MVLSDVDIKRYLGLGKIKITPELPPEQFGSCSVDFRLGNEFSIFEHSRHPYIDLRDKRGTLPVDFVLCQETGCGVWCCGALTTA